MKKINFVSDFFSDEINGGAEKCNEALIERLKKDYDVKAIRTRELTGQQIDEFEGFFIIANFFHLPEELKQKLIQKKNYLIYEHDHKYLKNNNPIVFKNFVAPESYIINKLFFQSAKAVVCQSEKHAETVYKNLLADNIVNIGVNFWTNSFLNLLENNLNNEKTVDFCSMATENANKGLNKSLNYAKNNEIELSLIPNLPESQFIEALSRVKNFIFFPQNLETYSRVAVEARILGCKIITNNLLGVASQQYFSLKGKQLLDTIKTGMKSAYENIKKIIEGDEFDCNFDKKEIPKITISCSFYKGDKFIRGFLEDITEQTIFDKCELIILNANSPGDEDSVILEYCEKFKNIIYKKLDYRATTTEAINKIIKELSTGDFITVGNIDDRRRKDCLEVQARHLMFNEDVDLVYSPSYQTEVENDRFDTNQAKGKLYEHSQFDFSRENMIKCLPGPLPMWRIGVHKELGAFNEEFEFANDWDMWLRMVDAGKKFMKINDVLGLYYFNPNGRSTSVEFFKDKIKEESKLFFRYKHIFGEKNFNLFKQHFMQGVEEKNE